MENAKKLTKRDASGKTVQWGYQQGTNFARLCPWIWQNGGREGNEVVDATKLLFDEPKAMEALKFLHDMIWKYKVWPTPADMPTGISPWQAFQLGKAAMTLDGLTPIPNYLKQLRFKWNVAVLPKGPAGRGTYITTDGHAIYRKTKYPREAVTFLKAVVGKEHQLGFFIINNGQMSCRRSLLDAYVTQSPGAKAGINVAAFADAMTEGYGRQYSLFVNQGEVRHLYDAALQAIFDTGSAPFEEGIRNLTKNVNKVIADYQATH